LVIYILEQAGKDNAWYQERFKDAEREGCNLSHEILGHGITNKPLPKYKERAVIATKWQNALLARRAAKDNIALNQPLYEFADSEFGKQALNKLRQILGKIRKAESDMENRVYFKRQTDIAPKNPDLEKNLNNLINDWKRSTQSKY